MTSQNPVAVVPTADDLEEALHRGATLNEQFSDQTLVADQESYSSGKRSSTEKRQEEVAIPPAVHPNVRAIFESFKRQDGDAQVHDHELKPRHLKMITLGGCIGTGLFVGAGKALAAAGPASVLLGFIVAGILLYCTMQSLCELTVAYPVTGSFAVYSTRFLDPAWGFAMGWNYALQWLVVLPLELNAIVLTINYWHSDVNGAAWVSIFYAVIILLNLYGVESYGEVEFWSSMVKVIGVLGFIIFGIVANCGGAPNYGYVGGEYWHNPGAFKNGYKGFASTLVIAAFAYAGTELIGLTAAETRNPRKQIPKAIKQVFWRIGIFYVTSILILGLLVSSNNPQLMSEDNKHPNSAFVIAIHEAGVGASASVFNAVIIIALFSVANASVFGSSRVMVALAQQGQAPKFLAYVDRRGRPLCAFALALAIGCIAFVAASDKAKDVLDWLLAISGLSTIFTWGSINLAHIRFRNAWCKQGRSLEGLSFRSQLGVWGSWVGFGLCIFVLGHQFWISAFPIGYGKEDGAKRAQTFFKDFLAVPIVLTFYFVFKFWYKTSVVRCEAMDLNGARLDTPLEQREHEQQKRRPMWRKVVDFLC